MLKISQGEEGGSEKFCVELSCSRKNSKLTPPEVGTSEWSVI